MQVRTGIYFIQRCYLSKRELGIHTNSLTGQPHYAIFDQN